LINRPSIAAPEPCSAKARPLGVPKSVAGNKFTVTVIHLAAADVSLLNLGPNIMLRLAVTPPATAVPIGALIAGWNRDVEPRNEANSEPDDAAADPIGWLIRQTSTQDSNAFAELFATAAPRVKAFALKGGSSMQMAEELAQETMIAVWRFAGRYDASQASGMTWIYAIARNKRIDLFRKERRPELDPEDPAIKGSEPENAEQILSRQSAATELHRRLKDLPAEQSEVIRMAFIEEKSHSVISSELGLALGTVKSRIRLGLSRLKATLSEFET
jgi:RNA polymerase sigma-70 factor (ECF subfamily)